MSFVIVGAGMAGAKAAETLRGEGYSGPVTLLGSETVRPYERPPLSKGILLGTAEPDSWFVHDAGWYEKNDVDLRLGTTVTAVDTARKVVTLGDGTSLPYEKLLLATGASPRPIEGALTLRTLEDSRRISDAVGKDTTLVVVGAGWIGLEVAAAAASRGATVHVVGTSALPLQKILGDEIARVFADLHRAHGVQLHMNTSVSTIENGLVTLADGSTIQSDVVVAGIGVTPNIALAEQAGLAVDNGVLVDAHLTTSDPDVFAAGDIADIDHPLLHARVRVEHWANALNTGPVAAKAMLGQDVVYDKLPYFFTDQYDLGMEYVGWLPPDATPTVVVRGDLAKREFIAFWLLDGKVAAGMNVNIWDVSDQIDALIRSGVVVDRARLADSSVPIPDLHSS